MIVTSVSNGRTRSAALALMLIAAPLVVACDDQPSAERTGQEVGRALDQAGDRIGKAADDLAAGAGRMMQDAGRALERDAQEAQKPEAGKP